MTTKPSLCAICGGQFEALHRGRGEYAKYCSRACYYKGATKPRKAGVKHRMKTAKGHPVAPPSGIAAVARINLYDKIGPGPHPCNWCGTEVDWMRGLTPGALIADHLDHDMTNDDPENLVASCNSCNSHRRRNGDSPRLKPEELTMIWGGARTRAVQRYCAHCGTPFLTVPANVKNGRGVYCSRSCARSL